MLVAMLDIWQMKEVCVKTRAEENNLSLSAGLF
jgi:hypothetical protein